MSMKIYIGYDFDNNPISVLATDDRAKADIAWAAMKDSPHYVEEFDPNNNQAGVQGLVVLLTSTEMNSKDFSHRTAGVDFRQWKRGI